MKPFNDLKLSEPLQRGLAEAGYETMTPVQAESLPPMLAGADVVAQAQTGSGKTAAFGLALLARLDPAVTRLQAMVLCPTRELADQVSREIRKLARFLPNIKVLTLCGGVPLRVHLGSLAHEPHIAVGTPGRLLDLIKRRALPLDAVKVLVLDEADRMLDMGFEEDMRALIKRVPEQRQTLLFSATIPDPIRDISRQYQREPLDISIGGEAPRIAQTFVETEADRKIATLEALLIRHRPESVVVFCNHKQDVRDVAFGLRERGFVALALHGDLDQREREEMLVQFANRSATVLVASDVAARGLDISELPMVINFDLAFDADTHVHRIGRTARAGRAGVVFNLVAPRETRRARAIEENQGEPITWEKPPSLIKDVAPPAPPFVTLAIDAGRQDKLRPGDVLGALTGDAGVAGAAVGKIDVFPTRTYVALAREQADHALKRLRAGKIKNRKIRIRRISR